MIDLLTLLTISISFFSFFIFAYYIWKYLIPKLNSLTKYYPEKTTRRIKTVETSIELLKLEFEYAKETSMQAQKDRLTLLNFYIGIYTAVFAGVVGLNEFVSDNIRTFLPYSLIVLGLLSFIFILQIVRLRQSWYSSAKAMNLIKEYFFKRDEGLKEFIKWTTETLPQPEKFKTVSYMIMVTLTVLGLIALVSGLFLLNLPTLLIILLGLLYLIVCLSSYHFMLHYDV